MTMTATERYEQTWKKFLVEIDKEPSVTLISVQQENHISISGMSRWMNEHGLSVKDTRKLIKICQQKTSEESLSSSSVTTGSMFLPVKVGDCAVSTESQDQLHGINFVFPDGTQVSVKHGSARAVMSFLKLYRMEDVSC